LPHQTRIPDDIYAELYKIKHSIEQALSNRMSDAPSVQDIVNVALKQFINDWQDPDKHNLLHQQLLEQRSIARSKMGQRKLDGG
jgi:hypothetical protein